MVFFFLFHFFFYLLLIMSLNWLGSKALDLIRKHHKRILGRSVNGLKYNMGYFK